MKRALFPSPMIGRARTVWRAAWVCGLFLLSPLISSGPVSSAPQSPVPPPVAGVPDEAALSRLLSQVEEARGGPGPSSLTMVGKFRRTSGSAVVEGEIQIEMLLPDKLLKTEKTNARQRTVVTLQQALSGEVAWVDRRVTQSLGDDGAGETTRGAAGMNRPEGIQTRGMRDVVGGTSVNRIEMPGATVGTERTVMGMPIPQPGGPDASRSPGSIRDAAIQTAEPSRTGPPGIENPEVQAALRDQLLREFACLTYAWFSHIPASFPLRASYGGVQTSENGAVEAIDLTGPNQFAARLFVDQASHRPLLLSYRDLLPRNVGYLTTARSGPEPAARPAGEVEEQTVQLFLADYRPVEGPMKTRLQLPFQMVRAVNGRPVDEWRVEKYRLNPGLKTKIFERNPGKKARP